MVYLYFKLLRYNNCEKGEVIMNQERIGKFISLCRNKKNLTQSELANKLGITDKAVSKWENGRCLPDLSLMNPLCEELGITINDLINGEYIEEKELKEKSEIILNKTITYIDETTKKKQKKLCIFFIIIITLLSILIAAYIKKDNIRNFSSFRKLQYYI